MHSPSFSSNETEMCKRVSALIVSMTVCDLSESGREHGELAALTALAQDSALQVVEATSVKHFGKPRKPPSGAAVHFCGNDPDDANNEIHGDYTSAPPRRIIATLRSRALNR
jgi:hypothetical protein